jgi:hypothetical protein
MLSLFPNSQATAATPLSRGELVKEAHKLVELAKGKASH